MAMAVSADLSRLMGALSVKNKVPESAHVFVDTPVALVCALDVIGDETVIAVDCEGVNLGRYCFHATSCNCLQWTLVIDSRTRRILLKWSQPHAL